MVEVEAEAAVIGGVTKASEGNIHLATMLQRNKDPSSIPPGVGIHWEYWLAVTMVIVFEVLSSYRLTPNQP